MNAMNCPTPNKRAYTSRHLARRHLWQLLTMRQGRRDWQSLHVYRCPCGKWHVGHGRRK